jgi:hypothetical protein
LPVFLKLSDKLIDLAEEIAKKRKPLSVKLFLSHLIIHNPKLEKSDLKNLINVNDEKEWSLL